MSRFSLLAFLTAILLSCSVASAQTFKENSVMASGVWRKVAVESTGIYCLTTSDLAQMGFTDPAKVRVYGAGGTQKSFTVGADERDDLYLLPTVRTGKGILFYAEGPYSWSVDANGAYTPALNAYSRKAYYYLTTSDGDDDAPAAADAPALDANSLSFTTYQNRFFYAPQTANVGETGRTWFADQLKTTSSSATVSVGSPCVPGSKVTASCYTASVTSATRKLYMAIDGTPVDTADAAKPGSNGIYTGVTLSTDTYVAQSSSVGSVKLTAALSSASEKIYVGTLTVVTTAPLDMSGVAQLDVCNFEQKTSESPSQFVVANAPADLRVWDVSKPYAPQQCSLTFAGSSASFNSPTGSLRTFAIFSPSASFPSPTYVGTVGNHNLHAHQSVNYLVVTTSKFQPYAERLCQIHEEAQGVSTRVVLVDDIYDEFSGGRPEAPAIRDYVKMLYARGSGSSNALQNVCLFGCGWFDNFDRTNERNIIPTYQTANSSNTINSYATDDFYAWLNKGEGATETSSKVRVGVGRIPCVTTEQAQIYVDKVEAFLQPTNTGTWRANGLFVGQSGDDVEHQTYAARQAVYFADDNPDLDAIGVYSEAYSPVVVSTGTTFPQANATVQNRLNSGTSIFHYTGHGGALQTGDGYLDSDMAAQLTNGAKLFVFVAASCHMASFDCSTSLCASSLLFNKNGGAIAAFAATRDCYGAPNYTVTRSFDKYLFAKKNKSKRYTFGEAFQKGKSSISSTVNATKYILLGDPGVSVLAPVELSIQVDSVNGVAPDKMVSPIKALENTTIKLSVRNADGSVDDTFNGTAYVTLYDKQVWKETMPIVSNSSLKYYEWGSKIFSGSANVADGRFEVSFLPSKEFDLTVGYGRLSAYAETPDGRDAAGASDEILVGDITDAALDDEDGPIIEAWIDFERDANGNKIGNTPILYAIIEDESGINISGQGVGHDISLVIDGDRLNPISLNDYFAYEAGSYTRGQLTYQLTSLVSQNCTLTLKAWDNLNNSSSVDLSVNLNSESSMSLECTLSVIFGQMRIDLQTNIPSPSVNVEANLYSLAGTLVGHSSSKVDLRNGASVDVSNLAMSPVPPGVYVLTCEAEADGQKASFKKRILIK